MTCAWVGRHLDVLKWARANGCDWDARTCAYAAAGGHLDVIKWARANGCEWDAKTGAYAFEGRHLEVLKWAWANGCDLDAWTCALVAQDGHLSVLKWAVWSILVATWRHHPPGSPGHHLSVACHVAVLGALVCLAVAVVGFGLGQG